MVLPMKNSTIANQPAPHRRIDVPVCLKKPKPPQHPPHNQHNLIPRSTVDIPVRDHTPATKSPTDTNPHSPGTAAFTRRAFSPHSLAKKLINDLIYTPKHLSPNHLRKNIKKNFTPVENSKQEAPAPRGPRKPWERWHLAGFYPILARSAPPFVIRN